MKPILTFLIILFWQDCSAQNIDFDKLNFQGLPPNSPRELIIEKLGNPERILDPNYECGFLSAEEQNKDFFTLDFGDFQFTGNETDNYILDKIHFGSESIVLNYSYYKFNSSTEITTLAKIFGMEAFLNLPSDTGVVIIPNKNKTQEDGFEFAIENGKLRSIYYWSPC